MIGTGRVCVNCRVAYVPMKNGIAVAELIQGKPHKLWMADLLACPLCGHRLISGFAANPFAVHWQEDFLEILDTVTGKMPFFEVHGEVRGPVPYDGCGDRHAQA